MEKLPDPDEPWAGALGMAAVPVPHPDSTVPRRSAPYSLVPVVGARSDPSESGVV